MAAAKEEATVWALVHQETQKYSAKELAEGLEKGPTETKVAIMQEVIRLHLNHQPQPQLLMTIIRFVVPSTDHTLKKLVLYYWEVVEKVDSAGRLLPEMLLVLNFLRNDLKHPNEYIRACTLRFLCKLREGDLVEPLVTAVVQNLEYHQVYIRRNAILAIHAIAQRFPHMLPDAADTVESFLTTETDAVARRNAFIALFHAAPSRAVAFLKKLLAAGGAELVACGDVVHLVVVDLLKALVKSVPGERATCLRVVYALLGSRNAAVLFQCAQALVALGGGNAACLRSAAQVYVQLLAGNADANVRLIVIDALAAVAASDADVLTDTLPDILRALGSPQVDVRMRALALVDSLVSSRNAADVAAFLKKELVRSSGTVAAGPAPTSSSERTGEGTLEYRQALVRALAHCTLVSPAVAPSLVAVLLDVVMENSSAAVDAVAWARDAVLLCPSLRDDVFARLCSAAPLALTSRVARAALWLAATLAKHSADVLAAADAVVAAVGPLPLVRTEPLAEVPGEKGAAKDVTGVAPAATTTAVGVDGTYVTAIAAPPPPGAAAAGGGALPVRTAILEGEYFGGAVVAACCVKILRQAQVVHGLSAAQRGELATKLRAVINGILECGLNTHASGAPPIDDDSHERLVQCVAMLDHPDVPVVAAHADASRAALDAMLAAEAAADAASKPGAAGGAGGAAGERKRETPIDAAVAFGAMAAARGAFGGADVDDAAAAAAVGPSSGAGARVAFAKRLARVVQLTGFADAVYAEADVSVQQYDIVLHVLLVNQTRETLQAVTLELSTAGDLRLAERPAAVALPPGGTARIKTTVKVASTESGVVHGALSFDVGGQTHVLTLNDVHVDIADYIFPAPCAPSQFRAMWLKLEWENPVVIAAPDGMPLTDYLDAIAQAVNMQIVGCQTGSTASSSPTHDGSGASPSGAATDVCSFLSATLYARSTFGEEALANVSAEKGPGGKVEGRVRVRTKSQGIALLLGEKIALAQKALQTSKALAAAAAPPAAAAPASAGV